MGNGQDPFCTLTRERLDNQVRRCDTLHSKLDKTLGVLSRKVETLNTRHDKKPTWGVSLVITFLSSATLMMAGYLIGQAAK